MAESRREAVAAAAGDQPLELILARNLVTIISLAAFLFDAEGRLVFYNDAPSESTAGSSRLPAPRPAGPCTPPSERPTGPARFRPSPPWRRPSPSMNSV